LRDVIGADVSPACNTAALAADDVDAVEDTVVDIFASWFNGILLAALRQKHKKHSNPS